MSTSSASILDRVWAGLSVFKWDPPLDALPNMEDRLIDVGPILRGTSCSDQKQSSFFSRLPLEIRHHIYPFVLPKERRIWVRPSPHRRRILPNARNTPVFIDHFPCTTPPSTLTWSGRRRAGYCVPPRHFGFFEKTKAHRTVPHTDTLFLMRTCQRV
ncbi:hypothetical protein B0T14DRAFT_209660 [Immersiella caudata]|uniref:DUF7730 domain-containing protein n=1 Tax=Immersiella caudata TaxID=314043 RepID=A0AA39WQ29_9PEZI|nr:hypothetical protein B0T14DRAFT_209660 [Immersiella caudata]